MTLTPTLLNGILYVVDVNAPIVMTNDDGAVEECLGFMFRGVLYINPTRLEAIRRLASKETPL